MKFSIKNQTVHKILLYFPKTNPWPIFKFACPKNIRNFFFYRFFVFDCFWVQKKWDAFAYVLQTFLIFHTIYNELFFRTIKYNILFLSIFYCLLLTSPYNMISIYIYIKIHSILSAAIYLLFLIWNFLNLIYYLCVNLQLYFFKSTLPSFRFLILFYFLVMEFFLTKESWNQFARQCEI